jgi:hypothetical protein
MPLIKYTKMNVYWRLKHAMQMQQPKEDCWRSELTCLTGIFLQDLSQWDHIFNDMKEKIILSVPLQYLYQQ